VKSTTLMPESACAMGDSIRRKQRGHREERPGLLVGTNLPFHPTFAPFASLR
jgi:hypothetical protein